jgi:hypothetical protein
MLIVFAGGMAGSPARIFCSASVGGATHIPLASLRMKMVREGLEDYEYMALLGPNWKSFVLSQIATVFPNAWQTNQQNTGKLYDARKQMACQILRNLGKPDPCSPLPPTCGPANCNGCCDANGACQPGSSDASCGTGGVACNQCTFGDTCRLAQNCRTIACVPPHCGCGESCP